MVQTHHLEELRFSTATNGVQFAMTPGTSTMLLLFVVNWDSGVLCGLCLLRILAGETDRYGWMMSVAREMKFGCRLAEKDGGAIIIAGILTMLVQLAAKEVRFQITPLLNRAAPREKGLLCHIA